MTWVGRCIASSVSPSTHTWKASRPTPHVHSHRFSNVAPGRLAEPGVSPIAVIFVAFLFPPGARSTGCPKISLHCNHRRMERAAARGANRDRFGLLF